MPGLEHSQPMAAKTDNVMTDGIKTESDIPPHALANREIWQTWAADYVEAAKRAWSGEPKRGIWGIPDSEVGLLPVDLSGLRCLEIGCGTAYVSAWLARRGGEEAFRTATVLVKWWLAHMIRDGARGGNWGPGVVPEEEGCAGRLFAAAGVDRWMEVWDKVSRLTDQVEGLNLDRKQVVINLFTTMAGAVRA